MCHPKSFHILPVLCIDMDLEFCVICLELQIYLKLPISNIMQKLETYFKRTRDAVNEAILIIAIFKN